MRREPKKPFEKRPQAAVLIQVSTLRHHRGKISLYPMET